MRPETEAQGKPVRKRITILCPVYNEQQAVPLFYERLKKVTTPLASQYDFELLFTNNRSTDGTLEIIRDLRTKDASVHVITLSRNFGYQASLQAGLSHAAGDAILIIDVDCEDPPEMIPQFLAKWEEGYDVVYGIRSDRPESWPIKMLRNVFYRALRATADMDVILYMAEFSLIAANVRDALINNSNTFPFFRSEIGYAGFLRHGIPYKRQGRIAGTTHYNLARMTAFALGGILTSSTFLFRVSAYIWPLLLLFNLVLFGLDFLYSLTLGFRALVLCDLLWLAFLVTIQGLYIARIYKNGMGRPVFIVDEKLTYFDGLVRNSSYVGNGNTPGWRE
jgi:glycosyltransferase involved in cell wall biosynthesis